MIGHGARLRENDHLPHWRALPQRKIRHFLMCALVSMPVSLVNVRDIVLRIQVTV